MDAYLLKNPTKTLWLGKKALDFSRVFEQSPKLMNLRVCKDTTINDDWMLVNMI